MACLERPPRRRSNSGRPSSELRHVAELPGDSTTVRGASCPGIAERRRRPHQEPVHQVAPSCLRHGAACGRHPRTSPGHLPGSDRVGAWLPVLCRTWRPRAVCSLCPAGRGAASDGRPSTSCGPPRRSERLHQQVPCSAPGATSHDDHLQPRRADRVPLP